MSLKNIAKRLSVYVKYTNQGVKKTLFLRKLHLMLV